MQGRPRASRLFEFMTNSCQPPFKMSRRLLQPRTNICQICEHISAQKSSTRQYIRSQRAIYPTRTFSTGRRIYSQNLSTKLPSNGSANKAVSASALKQVQKHNGEHATDAELGRAMAEVEVSCNTLLSLTRIPSEEETSRVLGRCEAMAKLLVLDRSSPSKPKKDGAASALLSLDESSPERIPEQKLPQAIKQMIDKLSHLAYSVVKFPPVFITPSVLDVYVEIQATLGKPETLPEILLLYANKPLPQEKSNPIVYTKQNPNKVANAVPLTVAGRALQTAVNAKHLVAAMDIIEMSYCTTAAHRDKFVRKGLVPATAVAAAPFAAYTIASQLSAFQTTMDGAMATQVAFVGILAYFGFTATVGVVAVTTANDQMDRVTWAQGVPLRERWMREEERAAIDKVAAAWGFREAWRRGEEEGEEWDAIREWVGKRAMMLDRVELMEGME